MEHKKYDKNGTVVIIPMPESYKDVATLIKVIILEIVVRFYQYSRYGERHFYGEALQLCCFGLGWHSIVRGGCIILLK